ncbi:MAG: FecR domain-containing protein [Deltaproteobacteria bacterium]|nr:FecR domain-containing protein [Deltaproteobacteria bacterium]MBN2674036.1 FecR domain-containing protein [Deltaproteobacteria bacterium]
MSFSDPYVKITEIQDTQLDARPGSLERVKRNVLEAVSEKPKPARHVNVRWLAVAAATATIALVLLVYFWPAQNAPDSMAVSEPSRWLVASEKQFETLTFADKSQIVLSPGSSARVLQTAPAAVRVLLEKGSADVRVTHRKQTDWLLEAGPYTVAVTGTAFAIAWDAQAQKFALKLTEGRVVVTGPMLEEGKVIEAGEQLAAWVNERRMELSEGDLEEVVTAQEKPLTFVITDTGDAENMLSRDEGSRHKKKSQPSKATGEEQTGQDAGVVTWSQMCQSGKYSDVVSQATARGLHASIQRGSLDDLMALGEAARLTRNKMVANETYQAVRDRFAGTVQSSTAAFYLGKMAFDQHHAYGVAARWLGVYLNEKGSGPFAKDALGKLFDAQNRIGDTANAKQNARLYLQRYPNGAHAPSAHQLLQE